VILAQDESKPHSTGQGHDRVERDRCKKESPFQIKVQKQGEVRVRQPDDEPDRQRRCRKRKKQLDPDVHPPTSTRRMA